MKPSQSLFLVHIRELWQDSIAPMSTDSSQGIQIITRLTAVSIGMMSILLWLSLCAEFLSGTTILYFLTHLLTIISLAALSTQIWRGSAMGWIGLKALLAFFVFTQTVEGMIQLANVYHNWQYDWTFAAVWSDGLSLFISCFTLAVSAFLLTYLNRAELKSFFGISPATRRTTDFFIGIFAAIMLTIASLG